MGMRESVLEAMKDYLKDEEGLDVVRVLDYSDGVGGVGDTDPEIHVYYVDSKDFSQVWDGHTSKDLGIQSGSFSEFLESALQHVDQKVEEGH